MEMIIVSLRSLVAFAAELCIPLVQLAGILVLINSALQAILLYFRHRHGIGPILAHGLVLALEFMLAGEVLHIVLADDWKELGVLAVGVIVHILLTALLHYEAKAKEGPEEEPAAKEEQV